MTDRLLTIDEAFDISAGVESIAAKDVDFVLAGAKAQDAKTLKAVGEWLKDQVARGFITAYPNDIREAIDALLRGEMPK